MIVIEQINFGCKSIEKMQKILWINTTMKLEILQLGFMDVKLEKKYRKLILYMVTLTRLLCAKNRKIIKYLP